jgi:hypothetical protein
VPAITPIPSKNMPPIQIANSIVDLLFTVLGFGRQRGDLRKDHLSKSPVAIGSQRGAAHVVPEDQGL